MSDVVADDGTRVSQSANGQYAIFQFKEYVVGNSCVITWDGQSNMSFGNTDQAVYLQIYNRNTSLWETIEALDQGVPDSDVTLQHNMVDLTNYKDANSVVSCRVYQLGT